MQALAFQTYKYSQATVNINTARASPFFAPGTAKQTKPHLSPFSS
jgi:hypothetical protein